MLLRPLNARAESDRESSFAINAEVPRILREEAAAIGAPVLQFSTDYLFKGDAAIPDVETSFTNPFGVYDIPKLAADPI